MIDRETEELEELQTANVLRLQSLVSRMSQKFPSRKSLQSDNSDHYHNNHNNRTSDNPSPSPSRQASFADMRRRFSRRESTGSRVSIDLATPIPHALTQLPRQGAGLVPPAADDSDGDISDENNAHVENYPMPHNPSAMFHSLQRPLRRGDSNEDLRGDMEHEPPKTARSMTRPFSRSISRNITRTLSFKKKNFRLPLHQVKKWQHIRVFVATWNVGNNMPDQSEFDRWLPLTEDARADVSLRVPNYFF
jgi:hypothetical protein